MTRIEQSDGILLRVLPFSETSRILVWLTPEHGILATLAKGACRPKSTFIGSADLFYTCELLYYQRPARDVHILREVTPRNTRPRFRADWRACAVASYAAGLLTRIGHAGTAGHPELYGLTAQLLDALSGTSAPRPAMLWFELQLLACLGLAPRLDACFACGKPYPGPPRPALFTPRGGGIVCSDCRTTRGADAVLTGADSLAALAQLGAETARDMARPISRDLPAGLPDLLGSFLHYHLDFQHPGRSIALQLTN